MAFDFHKERAYRSNVLVVFGQNTLSDRLLQELQYQALIGECFDL